MRRHSSKTLASFESMRSFRARPPQPHPRPAAVLGDELDVRLFKVRAAVGAHFVFAFVALVPASAERGFPASSDSRRSISFSTASKIKSVRASFGRNTASILAIVPSGKRASMRSRELFISHVSYLRKGITAVSPGFGKRLRLA